MSAKTSLKLLQMEKNAPAILFGAGIVGFAATTVLAARATLKVGEVLDEAQNDLSQIQYALETVPAEKYSEQDAMQDKVIVYAKTTGKLVKLYGPAVVIGIVSIGCLTKSHNMLNRRNVALTAAYAAVDKAFKDYRQRVVEEYGEEKDREFKFGSERVKETIIDEDGKKKTVSVSRPQGVSQYARFFDETAKNWKKNAAANKTFLLNVERYANDRLQLKGYLLLNEVYDMLGFEPTSAGCVVGWVSGPEGKDDYVDFGFRNGDSDAMRDFINGYERSVLLDFNVDGVVWDLVDRSKR